MKVLILLVGIVLLLAALYFHAIAQASVITKVERAWFERLFTGDRAKRDNLTEEGKRNRTQSNLCAVVGLLLIGVYLVLNSANG